VRITPSPTRSTPDFYRLAGSAINYLLNGLGSIVSSEPNNGDILEWNDTAQEWQPVAKVVGYATGSGGTVTQLTSKSTGVTLNKACGRITMEGGALAASTSVAFTLTNSTIASTDNVLVSIASGATAASYVVCVDAIAAGSCRIHVRNVSGGSLGEALVLGFTVLKGATS
jgi:hypothetical protein